MTAVGAPPATRIARSPVTDAQRRVWFLQTRDPAGTGLTLELACRLTGAVDVERLGAAVRAVTARHPVLRSVFPTGDDGLPVRFELAAEDIEWSVHDASDLPSPSKARRIEVLTRRLSMRPFDLSSDTPMRALLIRTEPDEFLLTVLVHTIAWDEHSPDVFLRDLARAYGGELLGELTHSESFYETTPLDPTALDYWRRALTPLPEALELPGVPPRETTRRSHRSTRPLRPDVSDRVRDYARRSGVDAHAVFLAALVTLVHRYTASTDFAVAVPVSTRRVDELSEIGYFGNTVLERATLRPTDPFTTVAAAVHERHRSALEHRHVGIDRVIRELTPDRAGGSDGLQRWVRVGFDLRDTNTPDSVLGRFSSSITCTEMKSGRPAIQVPLHVTVVLDGDGARLEVDYSSDHIGERLAAHLVRHYVHLLDAALAEPDRAVGDLELFDDAERTLIVDRAHGPAVMTSPTTLVSLFETRVTASPGAVAVCAPGTAGTVDASITYCELNARANRLAHWLIGRGIGTEDLVALRVGTSAEFVVAVLAVLKCGAAYLPLDPTYPQHRIDFLVADARPRLLLDAADVAAAETEARQQNRPTHDPLDAERVRSLTPVSLAYVIYTSGSTGQPKGVEVSHSAIAEHVEGFCAQWDMTADDTLLESSSVSFDASLLDIFVTLTLGARLVIPKPHAFADIPYVADLIARFSVTVLHMVPSMLSTFLMLPEVSEWRALRHVPVGGEALLGEVADRFAGVFDAELRNHYGPTEAVVSATHMRVDEPQGTRIVPIGKPNRGVDAYLLDHRLNLVPDDVIGEIYLGGDQLARSYRGRRALTAERFVADPFRVGHRLYRTGDLARRNHRGELEFVGRGDEQVKVRGYRIEPAEVEAVITAHPSVGQCAVTTVTDPAAGTVLVAYIVPVDGAVDIDHVRTFTAKALPAHMVPAAFTVIDAVPVTASGKLDRRSLPDPARTRPERFRAPRTRTETKLAALYAGMFEREKVGLDDSFFDLGGHSLLAAHLVALVRNEFGTVIDVRAPFDHPTVFGLAALIESRPVENRPVDNVKGTS